MTVLEVIQRSTDFLARRGVEAPRLNVELLLSHVLGVPRLRLYLSFDQIITDADLDRLRDLVRCRGERVPVQHLIGSTSFLGSELKVSPAALIPRPETEVLVQRAIQQLASRSTPAAILDFGTGSGCIAIALARELPQAQITALDISAPALELARTNARSHDLDSQISFVEGDGFDALPAGARFDLVVSNPPYIPASELPSLPPEVRDHDPHLALAGGGDGLQFYRLFAEQGGPWLLAGGALMAELGDGQAEAVRGLFTIAGWEVIDVEKDLSGRERVIIVRPPQS